MLNAVVFGGILHKQKCVQIQERGTRMDRQIKILHLGDLHLDSPFSGISGEEASKKNAELRRVFSDAINYAKAKRADIVLLCGDLFDREYYSPQTIGLLKREISGFPECRFVISPGNHDPYSAHSPYKTVTLPENCYVFKSEQISCISFPELDTDVYGYAFTSSHYTARPLNGFKVADVSRLNLLCAHADIGVSDSVYAPISEKELAESGLDYAALGHIHNWDKLNKATVSAEFTASNGEALYTYSGCIAGRDHGEQGKKGGVFITAELCGGKKRMDVRRITFCPWIYKDLKINVSGISNIGELADAVIKNTGEDGGIRKRYHRVVLSGRSGFNISESELETAIRDRASDGDEFKVCNEALPPLDHAELDGDYTLKGVFYRLLKPRLQSDDPEESRLAHTALEMGLIALDGGDPWDAVQF